MVDEIRVTRLLRAIAEGVEFLVRRQHDDDSVRAGEMWLAAVKYEFVTTIESCVDIAQHICAVDHLGTPNSNGDAIRLLGRAGILPVDLAQEMALAVGFRNVLVHEYIGVDDAVVVSRLADLSDFTHFIEGISRYLVSEV